MADSFVGQWPVNVVATAVTFTFGPSFKPSRRAVLRFTTLALAPESTRKFKGSLLCGTQTSAHSNPSRNWTGSSEAGDAAVSTCNRWTTKARITQSQKRTRFTTHTLCHDLALNERGPFQRLERESQAQRTLKLLTR